MLVRIEFDTDGKTNDEIFNKIALLQTILDTLTDIDADFKISVKQSANAQATWKPSIYVDGIRSFPPTINNINYIEDSEPLLKAEAKYMQGYLSGE
jgi:hypothetical protein